MVKILALQKLAAVDPTVPVGSGSSVVCGSGTVEGSNCSVVCGL
jgi:hypothetical protein